MCSAVPLPSVLQIGLGGLCMYPGNVFRYSSIRASSRNINRLVTSGCPFLSTMMVFEPEPPLITVFVSDDVDSATIVN